MPPVHDRRWVYVLVLIAITSGFRFLALFTLARRAASFF